MTSTACLLIDCADRRGLVAAIATFLFEHQANIIDADQHVDTEAGRFFMRVNGISPDSICRWKSLPGNSIRLHAR